MVLHVVEERDEDAGTAGADGMTEGDGAAAGVELFQVEPEQAGAAEGLHGEGFVDLDGIDLIERPARAGADAADGFDGAEAHERRIATDGGAGDDAGAGSELVGGDGFVAGEQDEGGAVVDAGGVAGGDAAVFAKGGLQGGEGLRCGVGAGVLVLADEGAVGCGDGHDLAGEAAAVRGGEALAAGGKGVLLGTGDAELIGDALCRLTHADAEHGVRETVEE